MSDKHGQITNQLGAILRTLREEKGLTREWVAEHSDTGLRHLAAIELGQKNPTVETLSELCWALDISLRDFFDDDTLSSLREDPIFEQFYKLTPQQRKALAAFLSTLQSP